MPARSPDAAVAFDLAGTVFRVVGLKGRELDWARDHYRPFFADRRPSVTIALDVVNRSTRAGPRRPRLTWAERSFDLRFGPYRAEGGVPATRVRLSTPAARPALNPAVLRVLCSFLLFQEGAFLLHAAGVVDRGRGWAFCGPSDSGKTTIARLARGRPVLNDDTIAVRRGRRGFTACATPFFGEGGAEIAARNLRAPLRALFFLRKADRFSHRRLTAVEVVEQAMSEVFLPKSDPAIVEKLLGALAELAHRVPCYELSFAPRPELWEYLDALA